MSLPVATRCHRLSVPMRALAALFLAALFIIPARAQNDAPKPSVPKPSVLVLPFQTSKDATADRANIGLAVWNVFENMLTLDDHLEESWAFWHWKQLFPKEADFQAWLDGEMDLSGNVREAGLRYLITGKVNIKGDRITVALSLMDRTTGGRFDKELPVDWPRLEILRTGFVAMLDQAGIAPAESQKARMLWEEEIPPVAFALLGDGLRQLAVTLFYREKSRQAFQIKAFDDGASVAPLSYLLLNQQGWAAYQRDDYIEARRIFEQALAINAAGADTLDGLMSSAAKVNDEAAEETWLVRKTEAQGGSANRARGLLWSGRANAAFEKKDYERAIALHQKAIEFVPDNAICIANLSRTYQTMGKFAEALNVLEAALKAGSVDSPDHLMTVAADTRFNWGRNFHKQKLYDQAIEQFKAAFAIDRERRPKDARYELDWIASCYYNSDRYEQALGYYQQALAAARALKDRDNEAHILDQLASTNRLLKRYDEAIAFSEQALLIYRELKARDQEAASLQALGQAYANRKQYDKAAEAFAVALAIRRELKDHSGEATTLDWLSAARQSLGQHEEALRLREHWLIVRRELKDRSGEGAALYFIGKSYRHLKQFDKAIAYYQQALAIRRELQEKPEEATTLNDIGFAYSQMGRHPEAVDYYRQSVAVYVAMSDLEGERSTLYNLAASEEALGHFDAAIAIYERALVIARAQKDREAEANALYHLGDVYQHLSQHDKTIDYAERALSIRRELKDVLGQAAAINLMGLSYKTLGQYNRALEHFERALALYRQAKDRRGECIGLNNLGLLYGRLGRRDRALEIYQQSLSMAREINSRSEEALSLASLGSFHNEAKDYSKAIEYTEAALVIEREMNDRSAMATALNNLGFAYNGLGDYDKALAYYQEALPIARELKDVENESALLNNIAAIHYRFDRYEQVIPPLQAALALYREAKDPLGEAKTLHNFMMTWKARKRPRLAIFYGKQAINLYQQLRASLVDVEKESQKSFLNLIEGAYRKLADLLIAGGRLPEAQQVLGMLKEEEYFDFIRRDSHEAASLNGRTELTPEEAEWQRRYNEIADRVTLIGRERGDLLAKASRTIDEEKHLASLESDLAVAGQAFEKFLNTLADEVSGADQPGGKVYQLRESQGLMQDLRELGAGTVALYTIVGEDKFRIILTTADVQKAAEYPITAADLNRKVLAFREVLQNPRLDPLPLAKELYQILVAPIAKDLQDAGAQTLMWSLDGVLRYVPVAALHDGEKYMVERYRNVVFTPASQARLKDAASARWRVLGLGVSKAKEGFDALPGAATELRGIIQDEAAKAGVLPGTIKLDEEFTADALKTGLRQRFPLVHIASHFQFRPGNDNDSFLLLGDGNHLTLGQIKSLPNIFGGVELLTLSACNTATGGAGASGKEVEGFGVLAQRQGAKAVMATLWSVADESTSLLMQEFYRLRESQSGMPKVEALRQAQLNLLTGKLKASVAGERRAARVDTEGDSSGQPLFKANPAAPFAHPYYWAPFILIGNWK